MSESETERRLRGADWLARNRNPDGAWGYRPTGESYVEPTSMAIAALLSAANLPSPAASAPGGDLVSAATGAVAWLENTQRADGTWAASSADYEASWMTACAVWTLAMFRDRVGRDGIDSLIAKGTQSLLVPVRISMSAEEEKVQRELLNADPFLVGWSWTPDTASWVFPSAWGIIAAISANSRNLTAERVVQGVQFLKDRACQNGGWNFGNPYMLGQPYAPNVVETSVALLALARVGDRGPRIQDGVKVLTELAASTRSVFGLAWASLALAAQGASEAATTARIQMAARQDADGSWRKDVFATSLAVLALGGHPSPFSSMNSAETTDGAVKT